MTNTDPQSAEVERLKKLIEKARHELSGATVSNCPDYFIKSAQTILAEADKPTETKHAA